MNKKEKDLNNTENPKLGISDVMCSSSKKNNFIENTIQNTAFTDTNKLQLETVAQQLTDITYGPTNDITIINNKLNVESEADYR